MSTKGDEIGERERRAVSLDRVSFYFFVHVLVKLGRIDYFVHVLVKLGRIDYDVDCCYTCSELSIKLTGDNTSICSKVNLWITSVLYKKSEMEK